MANPYRNTGRAGSSSPAEFTNPKKQVWKLAQGFFNTAKQYANKIFKPKAINQQTPREIKPLITGNKIYGRKEIDQAFKNRFGTDAVPAKPLPKIENRTMHTNMFGTKFIGKDVTPPNTNFENKINKKQAFGDDQTKPVVVEFYAKFNDANKFDQWQELTDIVYYRADIAQCPEAKKKYKVRMAPTLIIFKDGIKETVFKAGLDLELPADLEEIQEAINEINNANKF